jgi:hypothetical protein
MSFIQSSLKIISLSLLACSLATSVYATPDNDNSIRAADFKGNLDSGRGLLKITGDVTATDDFADFKQVLLTGNSNLRVTGEAIAPNGGRTDLLLVRDGNDNGRIDPGETISKSLNSFSHSFTRKNLPFGNYIVIIRSAQLSNAKVQYSVTLDARV